ncbi:MAG: hypothetical protein KDK08_02830 [Rhizobiaceae bacterium]|nr:hypothetical protein [Rhizobiaceae bacterium]
MAILREIYEAEKEIGYFPGWSKPEEETDYVWFDAPLEIGGVAETGLVIHGGCYAHRPDVNLTFELRIASQPGRRCIPLERLDWKSLEGGHSNKRKRCNRLAGRRVSDTHLHDFYLNWMDAEQRMQSGNLVCARDLDENLATFEDVREFAGNRLRINNIDVVSRPPWEYDFFAGGML